MFERFTREDKILVSFAMQEAGDLGHRQLGNDHLILGMLCNARSPLFGVLGEQRLTLATARDAVRAYHAERDVADPEADADDAQESAQQRYSEDREALRSIGIDLDTLREAVRTRFGDDLTEGWGERDRPSGRGRGRGRGRGHHPGRGHGHGPHRRGGRRGEGCGPFGDGPVEGGPGFGPGGFGPGGPGGFGPGGPGFGPGGPGFGPGGPGGFGPGGPGGPEGFDGPWEPGRGRRGPRGRGSRPRFAGVTRDALVAGLAIAKQRNDSRFRPEYLLLGILDVGDAASRAVIESATTVDNLKAAVLASLPDVEVPESGAEV